MKVAIPTLFSGVLLTVALGACSSEGDAQSDGAALVTAVPDKGFAGGTISIVLTGEATSFTNSSEIDFGEGITVTSAKALSSTSLAVEITAAANAPIGPRTITVDGHSLADGFTIDNPLAVNVLGTTGQVAQGSITTVVVTNLDMNNPFDVTTDETGAYSNLAVSYSGAGGFLLIEHAAPFELEVDLLLGPNAATGAATIDVTRGPLAAPQEFHVPVDVVARTPIPLGAGGTFTGTFASGLDSQLYEVSFAKMTAMYIRTPVPENAAILVLGPTGSIEQPIGSAGTHPFFGPLAFSNNLAGGDKAYLILYQFGTDPAGFAYSFDVDLIATSSTISHAEPNNTSAAAQAVTAPGAVIDASFTSETDQDWYSVQVATGDVGKAITVVTGGWGGADTAIQIFAPDGTTSISGDLPTDVDSLDRVTSAATTTAGTHYVKITPSQKHGPIMPNDSAYTVVIGVE